MNDPQTNLPVTGRGAATDLPFPEALRDVLKRIGKLPADDSVGHQASDDRATLNALASRIGVAQSHLWRVVNRPDERRATPELIASVARVLDLPQDYFFETRARVVDEYLRSNPRRLNQIYSEARRSS